jgi:hypothetical protein
MPPSRWQDPITKANELTDPTFEGSVDSGVAEVDLSVADSWLGLVEMSTVGEDVEVVIRPGLLGDGPVGLDLGLRLLEVGLGPVLVFMRGGVSGQECPSSPLVDLEEEQLRLVQRKLRRGHLSCPGPFHLLQGCRRVATGCVFSTKE